MKKVTNDFYLNLIVFFIPFALVAGTLHLTALVNYGPGESSGWIATALNAGENSTAWLSPMFKILTKTVGLILGAGELQRWLGLLTSVGLASATGFLSLFMFNIFKKWSIWAPSVLAIIGSVLFGVSRIVWASGTDINPYPWVLAALFASAWLLSNENKQGKQILFAAFLTGMAVSFHAAAIFFALIVLLYMFTSTKIRGQHLLLVILLFFLPLASFFLPKHGLIFNSNGFFETLIGYHGEVNPIKMFYWGLWNSLTPIALIFALIGVTALIAMRSFNTVIMIIALMLSGLFLDFSYPLMVLLGGASIAILTTFGLAVISRRIPDGLVAVLLIFIPLFWFLNGPEVSKKGQTIWRSHAENVLRTVRFKSLIFSHDETLVNTPYQALLANEGVRSDLAVVNPYRLIEPKYLGWVKEKYSTRFSEVMDSFKKLEETVNSPVSTPEDRTLKAKSFIKDWIRLEVSNAGSAGGVLVYTGFNPEIEEYTLIPEGLLWRVYDGGNHYPFLFRTMNMEPIRFRQNAPDLEHKAVALYPLLFTERGTWMLQNQYSAEGMDYIRWAQKIDPNYVPAGIIARQYGIFGEPQKLGVE